MSLRSIDVVVRGKVQGVGFRYSAQLVARRRGVSGWIRNRPDGAVEAHLEGSEDALGQMLEWLHAGPIGGEVASVEVAAAAPTGISGFEIRH